MVQRVKARSSALTLPEAIQMLQTAGYTPKLVTDQAAVQARLPRSRLAQRLRRPRKYEIYSWRRDACFLK